MFRLGETQGPFSKFPLDPNIFSVETENMKKIGILALQLLFAVSSESMGHHDSGPDDWWRVG